LQCSPEEGYAGPNGVRPTWSLFPQLIGSPLKLARKPLVDKANVSAEDKVKLKKPMTKEARRPPNQSAIDMFFQKKIESNSDRRTFEAAKLPDDVGVPHSEIVKPTAARPQMREPLAVVDPPTFLPIRTTTDITGFLHRLKVREFVLQCILQPLLFLFPSLTAES